MSFDDLHFSFEPEVQVEPGVIPDYVMALNDRQKEAVLTTQGPLIVLAGAGSGKTKMLTSRIAYLMDGLKVPASQILAVTFTNKAAAEMRARVERHLKSSSQLGIPEIGTFHSVCVRLLRRELNYTPYQQPFVIYDDSDQLTLIKGAMAKLNIDPKSFSPKGFQAAINRAKCDATEMADVNPPAHNLFEKHFKTVYEQYQKDLFANQAIDFGEIICLAYRILRDHEEVRAKYQRRFKYIHVDEYQDTNRAQYLLLSMLGGQAQGGHKNICVVGDEDQSIYKWRGADIRNILDFETDYPGAAIVKLEQNYRSTKSIITAASHVIRNNTQRKDKTLWTDNEQGLPVVRAQLEDERAEAERVIAEIKRLASQENKAYGDFAILYRTHAQSRQFEDVFRREKIQYSIIGGLRFYDRKEIKDVLSYFKVIMNPSDSISLKRIINTPARGIGKTTLDKIESLALDFELQGQAGTFWSALQRASRDPSITSAGTAKKLLTFVTFVEKLRDAYPKVLLSELYHLLLDETGYVTDLRKEGTEEALGRVENLEEFDSLLLEFEEDALRELSDEQIAQRRSQLLPQFLEQSSLASDADSKMLHESGSSVSMMTLHSCKGLEFPVVFMVGMEEGLFPSIRGWEQEDPDDIEEERRLCYVGMTRARELLFMTHVNVRRIWGNVTYQEPARFFAEIPANLVSFQRKPVHQPTSSVAGESVVGMTVDHPVYGHGSVIACDGSGNDAKVTIEFRGQDRRKFLLRFIKEMLDD